MDKPISVGDLVMVVKPRQCCAHPSEATGRFYRVTGFLHMEDRPCPHCGDKSPQTNALGFRGLGVNILRLKRIPPLNELENSEWAHKLDVRLPA